MDDKNKYLIKERKGLKEKQKKEMKQNIKTIFVYILKPIIKMMN